MNATILKAELLAYWRYKRQAPVVGVECFNQDVLVVTKSRKVVFCEIKVSISDLRADGGKEFHFRAATAYGLKKEPKNYREALAASRAKWLPAETMPNQFYFAVPKGLSKQALAVIEERYPYAGLLAVHHYPDLAFWGHNVVVERQAPELHRGKCGIKFVSLLVKSLTASLASVYKAVAKAQGGKESPSETGGTLVS